MKKILTFLLLLVSVFTVLAVSNVATEVEAANISNNTYIYFEKPSTWTDEVSFILGHSSYSQAYKMTKLTGTNIFYVKMPSWGGYTEYAFLNENWDGGESKNISHRIQYSKNETEVIKANNYAITNDSNLFNSEGKGGTWANPVTDLNVPISVVANGGGIVKATGYKISNNTAATRVESATVSILKYTNVTLTATANAGYKFVGWYDGNTQLTTSTTYTHRVTETKNFTAKFELDLSILNSMLKSYYNNGSYTKVTDIFADPNNEELETYFHASASDLHRTTVYETGKLTMTTTEHPNPSGYKDVDSNMVRFHLDANGNEVKDFTVKNASVDSYYATLNDFVQGSLVTQYGTKDLTADWQYDGSKYYVDDNGNLIEAFRLFVAPMWIETDSYYFDFTRVSIEETTEGLVMKLWISAGDVTKLNADTLVVDGDHALFAKAVITK